jgi:hypothetical protein
MLLVAADLPAVAGLENGFQISFLGAEDHGDGSSTWRYRVEKQEGARRLQAWGLTLPDCVRVLNAAPEGWEIAHPQDAPEVWGITWKTKGNLEQGEFAVTVSGSAVAGAVSVAAQAPKLALGTIAGPDCQ